MTLDAVLAALRPELAEKAREHMRRAKALGIETVIPSTGGFRPPELQIQLYGKGRDFVDGHWIVIDPHAVVTNALPDRAPHCIGCAYDLVPLSKGKPDWNDLHAFQELGDIGKDLGLRWGGDFLKLKDLPHYELKTWRDLPLV